MPDSTAARFSRRALVGSAAALGLAALPFPARTWAQDATPVASNALATPPPDRSDPLWAWNDGQPKRAILDFVAAVTDENGYGYVPPVERLAVFDLDGTLWVEKPAYVDLQFVEDRAREMVRVNPDLANVQPYADLMALDAGTRASLTPEDVSALVFDTFAGSTPQAYHEFAVRWLQTAENATLGRRHVDLTYLPMLQLMRHLEANGFDVAIASASDIGVVRAVAEPVFGLPRERGIGTSPRLETTAEAATGEVLIRRTNELDLAVSKDDKPIAIQRHLGRKPILAAGNSDGDLAMLGYVLTHRGQRLALLVHHDDAAREFAYASGTSSDLAAMADRGIVNVSMKDDFAAMFPDGPGPDMLAAG